MKVYGINLYKHKFHQISRSILVIKKIDEVYGMKLHILIDLIDGYHIITHHYIAKLRYN